MVFRYLKIYRSLKAPVRASIWFLICGILQKGISLITTPLFTRIMEEQAYGRFSVYNSWYGIAQIIVSLNLAAGVYTRGLVKNETDQERFTSSMLGLSTTCILVWTTIYCAFHELINSWMDLTSVLMASMLLEIWATAAYQFWSNRERVNYRYKSLVFLTLVYTLLRPIVGVISVLTVDVSCQVEARVVSITVVNLLLFTGLYVTMMRKGKHFFDKKYWCYALKFNIPLIPHYLSQVVLSQADRIMISEICGASQTAYYSVAYTLSMVLQILNTSISGTMNPWIYKSLEHGKATQIGKLSYSILTLVAICNLMVIAMAPEILLILAPSNYQNAVWVIPPVTASVYFMFLYNLFATFEYFFEKTKYVMYASVVGAIANVFLNSLFIPVYGYVAAGYTTLVCYILYAGAHYWFMRKVVKENLGDVKIYNAKIILLIGLMLMACAGCVMVLYEQTIWRYLLVGIFLVIMFVKRRWVLDRFNLLGREK